jgi:hypothetical protein
MNFLELDETSSSGSCEVFELSDLKECVQSKIQLPRPFLHHSDTPVNKYNNIKQEFQEYENKARENYLQAHGDENSN